MAGVLTLSQYLGGPDQVIVQQSFPSDSRTFQYDFGRDITGWTFQSDYQTLIIDSIAFNRFTGEPNFANSRVIGYFPKVEISGASAPTVISALTGLVRVNLPANMYSGPLLPDARRNVPLVIVGVTWTDTSSPPQTQTNRWALVQSWEPDVPPGDPITHTGFVALT